MIFPPFGLLLLFIFTPRASSSPNDLLRSYRSSDWTFYNPEPLPPPLLKLVHRIGSQNGSSDAVCERIYRVISRTELPPANACQKYSASRQAMLGDLTEFYHTLVNSGRFNQSLEFPLGDQFPRFAFRASFILLPSRSKEPAVMLETVSESKQLVCVQAVPCPAPVPIQKAATSISVTSSPVAMTTVLAPSAESQTDPFWEALLSNTEPKTWFLATLSLSCVCGLLLLALLISCLYTYRLRRLYRRRRCRGPCKSGCRCPQELIRQTMTDAAVCGPFLTPQVNGTVRGGGRQMSSPVYLTLSADQQQPGTLLSPSESVWTRSVQRRRLSHDVMCRSTSEGSMGSNNNNKTMLISNPSGVPQSPGRSFSGVRSRNGDRTYYGYALTNGSVSEQAEEAEQATEEARLDETRRSPFYLSKPQTQPQPQTGGETDFSLPNGTMEQPGDCTRINRYILDSQYHRPINGNGTDLNPMVELAPPRAFYDLANVSRSQGNGNGTPNSFLPHQNSLDWLSEAKRNTLSSSVAQPTTSGTMLGATDGPSTFLTSDPLSNGSNYAPHHLLSPRIYAASERML